MFQETLSPRGEDAEVEQLQEAFAKRIVRTFVSSGGKLIVVPTPVGNLERHDNPCLGGAEEGTCCPGRRHLNHGKTPAPLWNRHPASGLSPTQRAPCSDWRGPTIGRRGDLGTVLRRRHARHFRPRIPARSRLREAGIDVECLPCATALCPPVTSGLPCDRPCSKGSCPTRKADKNG